MALPRDTLESSLLAAFGVLGIVVGARSFAPGPVVAAPAPIVAPPSGGWPEIPAHARGVVKYALEAKLDPVIHGIDGKGTMTLENVSNVALSELRLHLYLNAFKNNRTVFRRARVGGFRGDKTGAPGYIDIKRLAIKNGEDLWPKREFVSHKGETPQDPLKQSSPSLDGAPDDETDVRIPLSTPLPAGQSITLEVEFHDQLPEVSERTGYDGSFHFAGQWFPKFAKLEQDGTWASFPFHHLAEFYADYGAFDVTIDVPEAFIIGASGKTLESKVEGGRRVERHALEDVHDFAWTAWDKFVAREQTIENVAVKFLSPLGYDAAIDREAIALEHSFRDKNARFGAYPYPVLTVVHPPDGADEAGGMEYPTLITTGGPWWPNHGGHEVEGVTIHEFGHQWFYGLVGTHEVEWPSGDEGFNSFADEVASTSMFGPGSAIALGPLQVGTEIFSRRGVDMPFDEPIFQPAYKFASGRSYGGRVYGATATVLLTLRRVYGPEKFDTAMGVWARKFRFQHPKPRDFLTTLYDQLGPEAAEAARVMLTTAFTYDVYVESISADKDKGPAGWFDPAKGAREKKEPVEGSTNYLNTALIGRRGALDVPVDIELRFADGSRSRRLIQFGLPAEVRPPKDPNPMLPSVTEEHDETASTTSNGGWYRIDADGPSALTGVIVDPDFKLPVDRNRLNNFASTKGHGGGAAVSRERALAWIEILARGVGP